MYSVALTARTYLLFFRYLRNVFIMMFVYAFHSCFNKKLMLRLAYTGSVISLGLYVLLILTLLTTYHLTLNCHTHLQTDSIFTLLILIPQSLSKLKSRLSIDLRFHKPCPRLSVILNTVYLVLVTTFTGKLFFVFDIR